MNKHERIWGWFDVIETNGGWEEFDEPVRRALTEIEQIPGLPDDFAIPYIKLKEGVGIRIEFDNAGGCTNAVWDIVNRVEAETWPLMIQRNRRQENSRKGPMTPEESREQFFKMIGMEV